MSLFPCIGLYGYLIAGAVSAIAASAGTYSVVHNANAIVIKDLKLEHEKSITASVQASLDKLQGFIANINIAGQWYQGTISKLDLQYIEINKRLGKLAKDSPLPLDCRPTLNRLQIWNDAIDASNKAASGAP